MTMSDYSGLGEMDRADLERAEVCREFRAAGGTSRVTAMLTANPATWLSMRRTIRNGKPTLLGRSGTQRISADGRRSNS